MTSRGGLLGGRVLVDWDPAPVVVDTDGRPVSVQRHPDIPGLAFIPSSTALSRISQTRWWSPGGFAAADVHAGPLPGRLRPSRTVMSFAV